MGENDLAALGLCGGARSRGVGTVWESTISWLRDGVVET